MIDTVATVNTVDTVDTVDTRAVESDLKSLIKVRCPSRFKPFLSDF